MTQRRIKMKSVEQPAESGAALDHNAALADQFLQDNDYLPVRGDQSWRERAALRIAPGYEPNDGDDGPDAMPVPEDRISGSELSGKGGGGILAAFFAMAIVVPTIVVLTAPGVLTAGFWGAHRAAPKAMAEPAAPLARMAANSAPLRPSLAKAAPPPPTSQATAMDRDVSKKRAANMPAVAGRAPKARAAVPAAKPVKADDGNADKFRTLVVGTDGSMKYEYFPSQPLPRLAQRQTTGDDGKGFYAMVPGPDGTLRYQYFPSKPVR
jgi:hypothetical protein